jgi:hypothetical protein
MVRPVTVLTITGFLMAGALFGLAAFLAHTPWRVHGGRFVTEYMLLAGAVAIVALVVLLLTLLWS